MKPDDCFPSPPQQKMVFVDSLIFGAAVSVAVAAAEAAVAKLFSLIYLRAGQPGTAIAIRLGFSGRSSSTSILPPARYFPSLLLATAAYAFLSAVRAVDTQITSAVPRVTTWTTTGMTFNRTIDLHLITQLTSNVTVTPQMAAAIYQGLAPPFDGGGYEWFAMAAKQQPADLTPLEPLAFSTTPQYATEIYVRDMSVTRAKKRDEVVVVGYGNQVFQAGAGLLLKSTRHVWIPRNVSDSTRTYAILNFGATIGKNTMAYNVTTVVSRTTFNLQSQPDNATDVSDSLCLWKSYFPWYARLVAVVTPTDSAFRVISSYDYVDDPLSLLYSNACAKTNVSGTVNITSVGDAMTYMKCIKGVELECGVDITPVTFAAKTSEYLVHDPFLIRGATSGDIALDVDDLLLGPVSGAVDYVEYNGKLVKIELSLIVALVSVTAASMLVVIWPCLRSENFAFGEAGEATDGSRGWSWELLAHRRTHERTQKYQEPAESDHVGGSIQYLAAPHVEAQRNHNNFNNY
ncbi:hypothetical protein DFJ73DRAFT_856637 [Zopfochytrium polystomum]|nr:hypothetical protein DFJ73DRAFT_856637 [Zopfochytrium polystomum]